MEGRLEGRIAVITGAANGIGRASAIRLAHEGADVAILDLERDALEDTAAKIRELGRRTLALRVDCTDEQAVVQAFADISAHFGRVDVLFNNVGQSARERASEFWQSQSDTWRFVVGVSLFPAMLCARQVVGQMRERRSGKIVNMSSESAFYGDIGLVDYSAAKMGIVGFTRALARELAPFRINVNVVCPGAIGTRAHDRLPGEVIDKIRYSVPMGYIAEPADVASVVAFLASDDSRYVTGQSILIDGGRWMI